MINLFYILAVILAILALITGDIACLIWALVSLMSAFIIEDWES